MLLPEYWPYFAPSARCRRAAAAHRTPRSCRSILHRRELVARVRARLPLVVHLGVVHFLVAVGAASPTAHSASARFVNSRPVRTPFGNFGRSRYASASSNATTRVRAIAQRRGGRIGAVRHDAAALRRLPVVERGRRRKARRRSSPARSTTAVDASVGQFCTQNSVAGSSPDTRDPACDTPPAPPPSRPARSRPAD